MLQYQAGLRRYLSEVKCRVYCLISNSRLDKTVLSRFPSNPNFPLEIKSGFTLQTAEVDATRDCNLQLIFRNAQMLPSEGRLACKIDGLYRVHSSCSFRPTLLPNSSFMEGRSESLLGPYQQTDVHTIRNQLNSSLHDRGKHKRLFLVVQQVQFGVVGRAEADSWMLLAG